MKPVLTQEELDAMLADAEPVEMDAMEVTASAPPKPEAEQFDPLETDLPQIEQQRIQDEDEIAQALRRAAEGEQTAIERNADASSRPQSNADIDGRVADSIINLGRQAAASINKTKPLADRTTGRDLGAAVKASEAQAEKSVKDRIMARAKAEATPLAQINTRLKLRGDARKERLGSGAELKQNDANLSTLDLAAAKAKSDAGQYTPGNLESSLQTERLGKQLQANGIEVPPEATNVLDAASARRILEDEKKLGKKASLRPVTIGNETGYVVIDDATGEEIRREMGEKPASAGDKSGGRIREDQLRRDYEKEMTGVREASAAIDKTLSTLELAKTNPEAVNLLSYDVARSLAGEKGPLSNQDVIRASGLDPSIIGQISQTLSTRGFGALTKGQIDTLTKLLKNKATYVSSRNTGIRDRYKVRANEINANLDYITGEKASDQKPTSAPSNLTIKPAMSEDDL